MHNSNAMADPAIDAARPRVPIDRLVASVDAFAAFVRRRTGDADLAAEVVQESLGKALASVGSLRDEQRVVPWFWQIVRNTMSAALERRGRLEPLSPELDAEVKPPEEVCACLHAVLAGLPQRQRTAIQLIEFDGVDPDVAADRLGITAGNLKVIRHRGRVVLKRRLEAVCRACADRACRDCDCPPASKRQQA